MRRARSLGFILGHGPDSNAFRAALTARSMSGFSPSATWHIVSQLAGLTVANVLPDLASIHRPLISIFWSGPFGTAGAATLPCLPSVAAFVSGAGLGRVLVVAMGAASLGGERGFGSMRRGEPAAIVPRGERVSKENGEWRCGEW